jgi:hypothetical protein
MSDKRPDSVMDGLEPIDVLMCTLLEGSASDEDKQEFLSLVESDARFSGQSELLVRLRAAVLGEQLDLDVLQEFLGALSAADGWDDFADSLRDEAEASKRGISEDLTDSIMAAVDERGVALSGLYDGELTAEERLQLTPSLQGDSAALRALSQHATLGRLIREAVSEHSRREDLSGIWTGVASAIGLPDPEYVEGWAPIGRAIKEAVEEHGRLTEPESRRLAAAIMSDVEDYAHRIQRASTASKPASRGWFRWAVPSFAMAAAAAAMLFTPLLGDGPEGVEDDIRIDYAEMDEAQIEDLEYAEDVLVHVMTEDDGDGPLIIMIDEDAGDWDMEEEDVVWDTGMEPI